MEKFLYVALMSAMFGFGWFKGFTECPEVRWLAAPIFSFLAGAVIRFLCIRP